MDEHADVKIDRRLPERIEIELAEIDTFYIGRDHRTDRTELLDSVDELSGRFLRIWKGYGGEQRKPRRVARAQLRHVLVEIAMPIDRLRLRQAMREDIRPSRQDLMIDALRIHRRRALLDRLDELRDE